MLSKNAIKHVGSLKIAKYRNLHNEFIAEGTRVVLELLNSTYKIKEIFASTRWIDTNKLILKNKNITVSEATGKELERITALSNPSEVVAVCEIPAMSLDVKSLTNDLIIMLDDIRDPGNLGTIIRTADWFGVSTILCSPHCVDLYNPKVIQSTMGSLTRVIVHYTDLIQVLTSLPESAAVYAAALDGENILTVSLSGKGVIIIGNESTGISHTINPYINKKLYIPPYSTIQTNSRAESLNAAVACSIILYEFRKNFPLN
jgi:TrmH family RNA methyltransferase